MAVTVTPVDIGETLGRATPPPGSPTYRQWARWITNAALLIRNGDGIHAGLGDLDAVDPDMLAFVITEAVAAMARRPDDATQVDVAVDDGRVSRTYPASTGGLGRIIIRDEWWAMLATETDAQSFSIGPGPGGCR